MRAETVWLLSVSLGSVMRCQNENQQEQQVEESQSTVRPNWPEVQTRGRAAAHGGSAENVTVAAGLRGLLFQ